MNETRKVLIQSWLEPEEKGKMATYKALTGVTEGAIIRMALIAYLRDGGELDTLIKNETLKANSDDLL